MIAEEPCCRHCGERVAACGGRPHRSRGRRWAHFRAFESSEAVPVVRRRQDRTRRVRWPELSRGVPDGGGAESLCLTPPREKNHAGRWQGRRDHSVLLPPQALLAVPGIEAARRVSAERQPELGPVLVVPGLPRGRDRRLAGGQPRAHRRLQRGAKTTPASSPALRHLRRDVHPASPRRSVLLGVLSGATVEGRGLDGRARQGHDLLRSGRRAGSSEACLLDLRQGPSPPCRARHGEADAGVRPVEGGPVDHDIGRVGGRRQSQQLVRQVGCAAVAEEPLEAERCPTVRQVVNGSASEPRGGRRPRTRPCASSPAWRARRARR